jgi:hypothetical protein
MNWYYVDAGQQAGPVDDAQLEELARSGKIRNDTLVWREGMENWLAYGQARPPSARPAAGAATDETTREAVCVECGKIFSMDDMIRHKEVYVCATCKPVFMQKLGEGIAGTVRRGRRSLPVDPDALIAEIEARGRELDIGSAISRGWALYKANFGVCLGATFLVMLCNQAAGFLPFIGFIISLLVQGPLMGGLYNFYIKLIRGESPGIGDAFSGFSSGFWRLCGMFLLMCVLIYVWFVPIGVYFAMMGDSSSPFGPLFWILMALAFVAALYLGVSYSFALPLCADLELGPWESLRVSWRVVSKRWFTVFGLMLVAGLLAVLGILGCLIGVIFTMPLFYAVTMHAYEDIFGAES